MQLLDRIRRTIRQHELAAADTRVVIALSGGPDSVALTHLLSELERAAELKVVGLAHFNHQLRPSADSDEAFCAALAAAAGKPFLADRANVAAQAAVEGCSIETAARAARHSFFERARTHFEADRVALGHTRDDQAETFLLRLLRGAGARGLGAMHPRRGALIRPLLDCRKHDLREYLAARGCEFVTDETNADVSIPRNRVRSELMPVLEQRFNPRIVDVLAGEAAIARDEWQWMESTVDEWLGTACRHTDREWRIDAGVIQKVPVALARRLICRVLANAAHGRPVSYAHVEAALNLVFRDGPAVDGPGVRMQRVGSEVVLTGRPTGARGRTRPQTSSANLFELALSIPGEVTSPDGGWALTAECAPAASVSCAVTGTPLTVCVRGDLIGSTLGVRNRRPGDRFTPPGLIGRKKLQDFFVDRKVARDLRDSVPIVVDARGRIVWVAGHAIDREFAVTDSAQAVVVLRLKLLGGRG